MSNDLRNHIVKYVRDGEIVEEFSQKFSVYLQNVRLHLLKDNIGTLNKMRKFSGRPLRFSKQYMEVVFGQMKAHAYATLLEHSDDIFETPVDRFFEASICRVMSA